MQAAYGALSACVPGARRLKDLEAENARLKKLLAEQIFENDLIKDVPRKSPDRTGATRALIDRA